MKIYQSIPVYKYRASRTVLVPVYVVFDVYILRLVQVQLLSVCVTNTSTVP